MADIESTQYAKFNTVGLTTRPDSIDAEGRIRFLNDKVVFVGNEGASDTVTCLPLPKGCKIDLSQSALIGAAMSGVTVDLGVNGDTDNLADGQSLASAGTRILDANAVDLVEVTDGSLIMTLDGGTPAASAAVLVRIAYYVR